MNLESGLFAWATELCYSLTLVAGISAQAALDAFGADPASVEVLTWQQASQRQPDGGVRAGQIPGWAFCFEYLASRLDQSALNRLSENTEALNLYYGFGKEFVTVHRDGRRVTFFEPGIQPPAATDDQHFAQRVTHFMQIKRLDSHRAILEMFAEHVGSPIPLADLEGPLFTALLPASPPRRAAPPQAAPPGGDPRRTLGPKIGELRL
jgi:hypothetical protein